MFLLFRKHLKCCSEEQAENNKKMSIAFLEKYAKNIFITYNMY